MQKLDVMIARLRLMLADAAAKETQLSALRRQLHEQQERVITFSLYGDADIERSLALMADVEQRVSQTELNLRHLQRIRDRAQRELDSLLLTKGVEEAKARLAVLHQEKLGLELAIHQAAPVGGREIDLATAQRLREAGAALDAEMRQLQQQINEASERAAKTLDAAR